MPTRNNNKPQKSTCAPRPLSMKYKWQKSHLLSQNLYISFLIYQILYYRLSILSLFLSEDNRYSLHEVSEQSDEALPKYGS